ncbi:hypothetical protein EDD11_002870 [Mortierella claussenii]|nr:hypothetical protein EDD11_002870 [Mortierella claussenii]
MATVDAQHGQQQAAFRLEPRHVHHQDLHSYNKQRRSLQDPLLAANVPIAGGAPIVAAAPMLDFQAPQAAPVPTVADTEASSRLTKPNESTLAAPVLVETSDKDAAITSGSRSKTNKKNKKKNHKKSAKKNHNKQIMKAKDQHQKLSKLALKVHRKKIDRHFQKQAVKKHSEHYHDEVQRSHRKSHPHHKKLHHKLHHKKPHHKKLHHKKSHQKHGHDQAQELFRKSQSKSKSKSKHNSYQAQGLLRKKFSKYYQMKVYQKNQKN